MQQHIHFIAIGGSAMHNLAIALSRKGYKVTGSDDEFFDPSKARLAKEGLLPDYKGWNPEVLTENTHAVIVGMHARKDNPELAKAQNLGLRIYSYPEYLYEETKTKTRVVVAGSHGKTTVTSMLLHALHKLNAKPDYMVGAQLDGFDCMVKLTSEANLAVIEGDEYLSSPTDLRPKFHLYKPNITIITGIAWDHINVFPTFENYLDQFRIYIKGIEPGGTLFWFEEDVHLQQLVAEKPNSAIEYIPYNCLYHTVENGKTKMHVAGHDFPLEIFGLHNLQNLTGVVQMLAKLGYAEADVLNAMNGFTGASKRLEKVHETPNSVFYKDFAHAPSKLKATTHAFKKQFPERRMVACIELHTFSSLNKEFLPQYKGTLDLADEALVYFNPEVIKHKKLAPITEQEVLDAFGANHVKVFTNSNVLVDTLKAKTWENQNLLMMTSGNFDGVNFENLAKELYN